MKNLRVLLAAIVVLFLCMAGTVGIRMANAGAVSASFPITLSVFVPCAADGAGEVVDLSGPLHSVISVTVNANNVHVNMLFNPQGISGTGETTGAKYQATGETRTDVNADIVAFPLNMTFVNNFKIIGQGPGNNFLVHENAHVTVNANGAVTALVDNPSVICH